VIAAKWAMAEQFSKETLRLFEAADCAIQRSHELLAERDQAIWEAEFFLMSRVRPSRDEAGFLAAFFSKS
jgi:hypothetical protein